MRCGSAYRLDAPAAALRQRAPALRCGIGRQRDPGRADRRRPYQGRPYRGADDDSEVAQPRHNRVNGRLAERIMKAQGGVGNLGVARNNRGVNRPAASIALSCGQADYFGRDAGGIAEAVYWRADRQDHRALGYAQLPETAHAGGSRDD